MKDRSVYGGVALLAAATLAALLALAGLLHAHYQRTVTALAAQHGTAVGIAYDSVVNMYRLAAEAEFRHQVMQPRTIELLRRALIANPDELPIVRGLLYRHLRPAYQDLERLGLRQLQFHTPQGLSLLRFHRPERAGDALFDVRPSVRIANEELRPVIGFEGGRVLPGFRYVFPIIDGDSHLGSVELSMSFEQIHDAFTRLPAIGDSILLLRREITRDRVFDEQREKFSDSPLHPDYVTEHPEISRVVHAFNASALATEVLPLLRDPTRGGTELGAGVSFSVPVVHSGRGFIASFHGIRDVQGRHAAYVLAIVEAPRLPALRNAVLAEFAVGALLIVLAAAAMARAMRQRREQARERQRLDAIAQSMEEGLYVLDRDGRASFVNQAALTQLGYASGEVLGRMAHDVFHNHAFNQHLPLERCPIFRTTREGEPYDGVEEFRARNGRVFPAEVHSRPLLEGGRVTGAVTVFRDISAQRAAEAHTRLLVSALQAARNAIVITDSDARIEWANPAFEQLTGYTLDESLGRRPADLVKSGKQDDAFYTQLWKTVLAGDTWHGELINRRKDGSLYHEELTITPVPDDDGVIRHFVAVKHDISARKQHEEVLVAQATTDALTGLPNRRHFLAHLDDELARLRRFPEHGAALLMLDLDRFKRVNDAHGHAVGDRVLRHFAQVLRDALRKTDLAGRLGGEEFAVLLTGVDLDSARDFADRLRQRVADAHVTLDTGTLRYTVSIGVALIAPADTADDLLARADAALYSAKQAGRNRVMLAAETTPT